MLNDKNINFTQNKNLVFDPLKVQTSAAKVVDDAVTNLYQKSPLLTTEQAAKKLNIHPSTLEKGRQSFRKDLFPPYIKLGRSVRYREKSIDDWIDRNTIQVGSALA